jgi:hypothetical protein
MNEPVQKFCIEATTYTQTWAAGLGEVTPLEWKDTYNKKFAELIVRECCLQVADVRIENDFEPVGDAALVQALTGIKRYFGVEE